MRNQIPKKLNAGETSFNLVRQFRNMLRADNCNLSVTEGSSNAAITFWTKFVHRLYDIYLNRIVKQPIFEMIFLSVTDEHGKRISTFTERIRA